MKKLGSTLVSPQELLASEQIETIKAHLRNTLGDSLIQEILKYTDKTAVVTIRFYDTDMEYRGREFELRAYVGELPRRCSKCGTPIKPE